MKKHFLNHSDKNRGSALISVLIAVAFIAILGSTLLYMAYTNYSMKVVNSNSKINFYGTEAKLTEMTTVMRNKTMTDSNPVNKLEEIIGVDKTVATYSTGVSTYSNKKLAELLYPAASVNMSGTIAVVTDGTDTIFIGSGAGSGAYTKTKSGTTTEVRLQGVEIEKVSDEDYENTIVTDIVFRIRENTSASTAGGIGEFSMLMDNMLTCTVTEPCRINLYGNTYLAKYQYDSVNHETKAGTAISMHNNSMISFLGDYTLIYGDIELHDNAILYAHGKSLTVYGDIKLFDNASIICDGDVYFPSGKGIVTDPVTHSTANIKPASLVASGGTKLWTDENINNFRNLLKLKDADQTNDGVLPQIMQKQEVESNQNPGQKKTLGFDELSVNGNQSTTTGYWWGHPYYTTFNKETNFNSGLQNRLCFNLVDAKVQEENTDTTVISYKQLTFEGVHNVVFSQLGSDAFAYLTLTDTSDSAYDSSVHEIVKAANSGNDTYNFVIGNFFKADANATVNQMLGFAVNGGGGTPTFDSAIGYDNWTKE